jgi:hypothetical protein
LRAEFYTKTLYPTQDKVTSIFKGSPFYLTGGTALSRGYYNHRYSDDLDYFVNDRPDFQKITKQQIEKLRLIFTDLRIEREDSSFTRLFVAGKELIAEGKELKIELINDVPSHIGKLVDHPVLGTLDSKENILANKITALVDRALPKDAVDIFFLLRDGLDIKQTLLDADSKAAGINPLLVAKYLNEFNYSLINNEKEIQWVKPVSNALIKEYLNGIALDIVNNQDQHQPRGRHR